MSIQPGLDDAASADRTQKRSARRKAKAKDLSGTGSAEPRPSEMVSDAKIAAQPKVAPKGSSVRPNNIGGHSPPD
jgi:hypothetical protein